MAKNMKLFTGEPGDFQSWTTDVKLALSVGSKEKTIDLNNELLLPRLSNSEQKQQEREHRYNEKLYMEAGYVSSKSRKGEATTIIFSSLAQDIKRSFSEHADNRDPLALWKAIDAMYNRSNASSKAKLLQKLSNEKMGEDERADVYLARIKEHVRRLKELGVNTERDMLLHYMLSGLPHSWSAFVQATRDNDSFEELESLALERKIKHHYDDVVERKHKNDRAGEERARMAEGQDESEKKEKRKDNNNNNRKSKREESASFVGGPMRSHRGRGGRGGMSPRYSPYSQHTQSDNSYKGYQSGGAGRGGFSGHARGGRGGHGNGGFGGRGGFRQGAGFNQNAYGNNNNSNNFSQRNNINGACFRCGKVGHSKRECTAAIVCRSCGRSGHIEKNCYSARSQQGGGGGPELRSMNRYGPGADQGYGNNNQN